MWAIRFRILLIRLLKGWVKVEIKKRDGRGRPKVDTDLKNKGVMISLPIDLKDQLDKVKNKSRLIQDLLELHFNSDHDHSSDFKFSNFTPDSLQNNIQIHASLPNKLAEHKRFDENKSVDLEENFTDSEHIKYDTNKLAIFAEEYGVTGCIALLTILKDELKKTKAELAERIRLENEHTADAKRVAKLEEDLAEAERIKIEANKLSTFEKEINLAKIELEKRKRIEEERIKVIPTKHVKLETEFNKVRSFEKETRLKAEQIKVDEDKLSVLKNVFNQAHAGLEEQLRLETAPPKLYENTSITKYKLGDIGPNGGKIFYINDIGNIGAEVKLADEDQRMNWFDSVSKLGNNWRLPNKNELELLYKQKDTIENFSMYAYWSSTEYNDQEAWAQFFNAGDKYPQSKNLQSNVRAVRSFQYSANNESPKYENLKYINPNPEKQSVMPIISTEKLAENLTRSSVSVIKDENTDKFEGMF